MKRIVVLATGLALLTFLFVFAQETKKEEPKPVAPFTHLLLADAEITWADAPPSLPPGAKLAVLEGDPTKEGPFTMRIKVPAGYKVPPHFHPALEHATVVSGTVSFGLGEKFDQKALKEMPAGSFMVMATGTRHFAWSKDGGIVQIHGIGPWGISYVNPADDPRQAKATTTNNK